MHAHCDWLVALIPDGPGEFVSVGHPWVQPLHCRLLSLPLRCLDVIIDSVVPIGNGGIEQAGRCQGELLGHRDRAEL